MWPDSIRLVCYLDEAFGQCGAANAQWRANAFREELFTVIQNTCTEIMKRVCRKEHTNLGQDHNPYRICQSDRHDTVEVG
jgi:hypothetical protein